MSKKNLFWHRTPPALFPCCLGLLGLGLLWRRLGTLGVPGWVGEGLLFSAVLLFLGTFVAYMLKVLRRPNVVFDDLKVAPARGAVSAGSMCWMLVAAAIIPYAQGLANLVLWGAVVLHLVYLWCVWKTLLPLKDARDTLMPTILLPFVGVVVAGVAGAELGYIRFSIAAVLLTAPLYILIVAQAVANALKGRAGVVDRAGFAIILAPISIYALVFFTIGTTQSFSTLSVLSLNVFYWLAYATLIIGVVLVLLLRWMCVDGYKPSWAAFTFPSTAFAAVMAGGVVFKLSPLFLYAMWAGVIISTAITFYVTYRTYRLWALGKLVSATKAAIA